MTLKAFFQTAFTNSNDLFENNKEAIHNYNKQIVPKMFVVSIIALIIPLLFSIFKQSMLETLPAYLITFGLVCLIFIIFKVRKSQQFPLVFAYLFGFVYYGLFFYLSIIRFSDRPAGTLLTFFVIVPLIVIDKSSRVNLFTILLFVIHLIHAYVFKGIDLGTTDFVNTVTSLMLGILFGRIFLITRLKTFEIQRQLNIEKEMDFLTKLYNRRKLYQDLKTLNESNIHDVAIMMFDVDYFKEYNDTHGHLIGDKCLEELGRTLLSLQVKYDTTFYRFGGEEFVGIGPNMTKYGLLKLAEELRTSLKTFNVPNNKISISVGISIVKINPNNTIDDYLTEADQALYQAKAKGRDRVEVFIPPIN
ncbi:GGDEF domain-containing protein [Acholeplasma equirhinis]|uniref:GGDEF domain-containing protein n=1 Tax=Acholeplasma equirhinis TaxID=555393 RepID=UPI00197A9277|nr:GGDEF domain-containing protein [Acholeplasma equirhinis]MBN3490436.1 GGDEF domain-containing protein [Acholeplasma equirhinis]